MQGGVYITHMEATHMIRNYPSYTTAQLESAVAAGRGNETMVQEIANRKSGVSVIRLTPQIMGGKVMAKVGRL